MVIKRLFQTAFPRFRKKDLDLMKDEAPSLYDTDASSDSSSQGEPEGSDGQDFVTRFNMREAKCRKKEDEDVVMFMSLVDRMSVKSLVFLLQAHARSMHNVQEAELQQTLVLIQNEKAILPESQEDSSMRSPKTKKRLHKKCRFAEIMGGQHIRTQVFEIPHAREYTPEEKTMLWWSSQEMKVMRMEAAKVVRFFREHRPEYSESVNMLLNANQPDADDILVEHHLKKLANNSFPRGLEFHIVPELSEMREQAIQSVLLEQNKYRAKLARSAFLRGSSRSSAGGDGGSVASFSSSNSSNQQQQAYNPLVDEFWQQVRESYVAINEPSHTLAVKIAECDHIEALKASLSRWAPAIPASSFARR